MPEMNSLTVNGVKYDLRDPTKAPAGYGLGTHSSYFDFNNVDSITKNGWYCFATSGITLAGHFFGQGIMEVCCYDENAVRQVIHPAGNLSMEIVRQRSGGIWGEWVNCSPSAFAPSGYGLGAHLATIAADVNSATRSGWYLVEPGATNSPNSTYYAIVRTDSLDGNSVVQNAYMLDGAFSELIRRKIFGTWGEWEWVNPPMTVGVEYRTTERWNGKPVWVMAFGIGNLPNNSTMSVEVPWQIGNQATGVISALVIADNGSYLNIVDSANPWGIWVITKGDYSAFTATMIVKYIKS